MQLFLNFTKFACGAPLPFVNLPGLEKLVVLLQKVIGYPFSKAFGNRELHATSIMSAIYCWENLIKISKMAATVFYKRTQTFY